MLRWSEHLSYSVAALTHDQWSAIGSCVGGFAGVIAACGTVGALVFSIRSSNAARRDATELRRELAKEKTRQQATAVCAWIRGLWSTDLPVRAVLSNTSQEPVYNVVVFFVWHSESAWHTGEQAMKRMNASDLYTVVQTVPPGSHLVTLRGPDNLPHHAVGAIELAFTDAAGRNWIRRATGALEVIDGEIFKHYGIVPPVSYQSVKPLDAVMRSQP